MQTSPFMRVMLICATVMALAVFALRPRLQGEENSGQSPASALTITVQNVTAGQPITNGETIPALDQFQVTVTVAKTLNCTGQFVVSALDAKGGPPTVLEQNVPYTLGPAAGSDSVLGELLTSTGFAKRNNDWKTSATCQPAPVGAFVATKFEFFSQPLG